MKKIKITEQQFKRISKSLKEGMNPIDKNFKQAFSNSKIKDFIKEGSEDSLEKETIELINYLYRKSEDFSPFWGEHDLSYDDICDALESKGMIIKKDGKYKVSKSLGSSDEAIKAIQLELNNLIGGEEAELDKTSKSEYNEVFNNGDIKIFEDKEGGLYFESCNYEDLNEDETSQPNGINGLDILNHEPFNTLPNSSAEVDWNNRNDVFLPSLQHGDSLTQVFSKDEVVDYVKSFTEKNGEEPVFSLNSSAVWFDKIKIMNPSFNEKRGKYVSDKDAALKKFGTTNEEKARIDNKLKNELLNLYDKDNKLSEILSKVNELTDDDIRSKMVEPFTKEPSGFESKSDAEKQAILDKIKALRAKSHAQDVERFSKRDKENSEKFGEIDEMGTAGAMGGTSTGSVFGTPSNAPVGKFGEPLKRTLKENFELGKGYTHFAIFKADNKIATGWDYSSLYDKYEKAYDDDSIKEYSREDIMNDFPDNKVSDFKLVTRNFLDKKGINPSDSNNWYKPNINEVTQGSDSIGQYTAPAFKMKKNHTDFAEVNPKAFQKTQYDDGSFVDFDDCTKANNNKTAQKGGCSAGAVDGVVKQRKSKGNVNAPSLSENEILEAISKKTGKTIDEVKRIIDSKKNNS